jgi:putative ABC transport system ATP-binding protein
MAKLIEIRDLSKVYERGKQKVEVLHHIDLDVDEGDFLALMGPSGSGKTTLLNLLGGLDRPDSGTVHAAGTEVTALDDDGLSALRRESISYVFQTFGLVPALTAAENVGVPLRLRRTPVADRERRVALLLDLVGLRDHARQRPAELSGGQQQRVAIARALAGSPRLLLADEPTGQLDAETGLAVMGLLRGIVDSEGITALVATHDPVMRSLADRVLTIADGRVEG